MKLLLATLVLILAVWCDNHTGEVKPSEIHRLP